MGQLSEVLYGWIINNVDWKKDPELARKIRGADGDDGFSVDSNGAGLYAYLRERGSHGSSDKSKNCQLRVGWAPEPAPLPAVEPEGPHQIELN